MLLRLPLRSNHATTAGRTSYLSDNEAILPFQGRVFASAAQLISPVVARPMSNSGRTASAPRTLRNEKG